MKNWGFIALFAAAMLFSSIALPFLPAISDKKEKDSVLHPDHISALPVRYITQIKLWYINIKSHFNLHSAAFQLAAQIVMKVFYTFQFSCYNRLDYIRHSRHQYQMHPPILLLMCRCASLLRWEYLYRGSLCEPVFCVYSTILAYFTFFHTNPSQIFY